MSMPTVEPDRAWGSLTDASENEREARIVERYVELAKSTEQQRQDRMFTMALAEYALPDDKLRAFTKSRLKALLKLDTLVAENVGASYAAVMKKVPGPTEMRYIALAQTMAREFSSEEILKLREMDPNTFGALPAVVTSTPARATETPVAKKSGWWPFSKTPKAP